MRKQFAEGMQPIELWAGGREGHLLSSDHQLHKALLIGKTFQLFIFKIENICEGYLSSSDHQLHKVPLIGKTFQLFI